MATIDTSEGRIGYLEQSPPDPDDLPILFLHGVGGNRTNWSEQLPVFAERFTAVAWDARGYGDSDDYPGNLSFADLGRDVGERNPGRLARPRAGAGQSRIDLDHPVLEAVGVESVLDVAFPNDAEMPDCSNRDLAQEVVLFIIQGLRGSDHDRLTGMDAHRVEVFHVAHRDAVIPSVANDLVLDLLPTSQALLDKNLHLFA